MEDSNKWFMGRYPRYVRQIDKEIQYIKRYRKIMVAKMG